MDTFNVLCVVTLTLYVTYSVAFYREGFRTRGGPGLKALCVLFELFMYVTLVWGAIP